MRAPLPLLVLAAVVGCAEKLPDAHVHPVLAAERAFSRTSVEQGAKAAFLANLADDAIVFSPEPTPGRAYYQSQPDADAAARKTDKGPVALYDFENDTVNGKSLTPDHEPIYRRMPGQHESLIRVRTHFIPQMLHMADDV